MNFRIVVDDEMKGTIFDQTCHTRSPGVVGLLDASDRVLNEYFCWLQSAQ